MGSGADIENGKLEQNESSNYFVKEDLGISKKFSWFDSEYLVIKTKYNSNLTRHTRQVQTYSKTHVYTSMKAPRCMVTSLTLLGRTVNMKDNESPNMIEKFGVEGDYCLMKVDLHMDISINLVERMVHMKHYVSPNMIKSFWCSR